MNTLRNYSKEAENFAEKFLNLLNFFKVDKIKSIEKILSWFGELRNSRKTRTLLDDIVG